MRQHTDTSERGLENLIVRSLTDEAGYAAGDSKDFNRDHAIDVVKLFAFLNSTQPDVVEALGIGEDGPRRLQFLHRLQGEIAKRGVIDVLRNGVKHGPGSVELFFGTPPPATPRPRSCSRPMYSASRANCTIPRMKQNFRSTPPCSSTACLSPLSS